MRQVACWRRQRFPGNFFAQHVIESRLGRVEQLAHALSAEAHYLSHFLVGAPVSIVEARIQPPGPRLIFFNVSKGDQLANCESGVGLKLFELKLLFGFAEQTQRFARAERKRIFGETLPADDAAHAPELRTGSAIDAQASFLPYSRSLLVSG